MLYYNSTQVPLHTLMEKGSGVRRVRSRYLKFKIKRRTSISTKGLIKESSELEHPGFTFK